VGVPQRQPSLHILLAVIMAGVQPARAVWGRGTECMSSVCVCVFVFGLLQGGWGCAL